MNARIPLLAGAIVGLLGVGALAFALSWPTAAVAIAALLGLIGGAALGQGLSWLRTVAGGVTRVETKVDAAHGRLDAGVKSVEKRVDSVAKELADVRKVTQSSLAGLGKDQTATTQALRVRVEELFKRQSTERRQLRSLINHQVKQQAALLAAFTQLQRLVPMPLPMPRPGAWAASEDYLLWLAGDVLERRPEVVVDLGSGQSSIWMAGAMRAAGYSGRVIAIDHDADYAAATVELGRRQGVSEWLHVVHAPLVEQEVGGREVTWYDPAAFADVSGVGLLSVDGPPAADNVQARWPALPALHDRLAPQARIVLDDMVREDEQEIARDWCERYPDLTRVELDFEKGALVLLMP